MSVADLCGIFGTEDVADTVDYSVLADKLVAAIVVYLKAVSIQEATRLFPLNSGFTHPTASSYTVLLNETCLSGQTSTGSAAGQSPYSFL